MPWYQTTITLVLAGILLPPVGLVLLWIRSGSVVLKILGSLVIGGIGLAHLFLFYGLRLDLDGSASRPFLTFRNPESHYKTLEADRAAHKAEPTPPPVESVRSVQAAPETAKPRNYWTDFRGPNRLGIYDQAPILTQWPAGGLKRLWKQPVGGGYASFVVADGLAFTIEQRRDQEVVAAYDVGTGRERWTNSWKALFQEGMGGDGPRTTPVYDEGRVYALGAEGEMRCIEAGTGKVIWNKNILTENGARNLTWAQSASPLIVDGKVIVLPGGSGGKSVVAYDKVTGKTVWSSLDDEQSYTSPMVVTLGGKRQLLIVSALRAMGLTIEDGKLLWDFPWVTEYHINSAQPLLVGPNRFFISAGYGHGAALVELTPEGEKFKTRTVWQNTKMKNKFNTSVLYQGHIYGMDEAILACIHADTGDLKWKGGRYGYGQLLLADGHLVVLTESGEVVLVKANPAKHEEVAQFSAIEGKTWNHPAIAGGVLFVRNTTEMAAFQIGR